MDAPVQLVFFGEVLAGFQPDAVKRDLGQALKLDEARIARLFSGARMVLKRSIANDDAQRYVKRLEQLGARIHVEPALDSGAPVVPPAAAISPPAAPLAAAPLATPVAAATIGAQEEEQIECPNCGERQSKRILCRACATDMPMGIAAKLEADQEARAARLAEVRARRGLRETAAAVDVDPDAPPLWGFGFSGRVARLPYATASAMLLTVMFLLAVFAMQRPGAGRVIFAGAGFVLAFVLSMRLAVLRCHDCNRHGWWSLFLFVPYAGFVTSLVMSLMPGTPGDNDFGGQPRQGRWAFLLLALIGMGLSVALTARTVARLLDSVSIEASQEEEPGEAAGLEEALGSSAAAEAFRNEYALAPTHKAFAVSSSGSWGYRIGVGSMDEAVRGALANCEAHRKAYTPPCGLINVNGQWAPGAE